GEESTFTVAALRSVGIPARQVYCPRWAHTDDNHAWVEVWICNSGPARTGSWHFMGACEPEATLDKGWFNWASSRAMLVRTYDHEGNEIQTTSTYAPTKTLTVHVADETGKPVSDATVDFRLYNYSEFYPPTHYRYRRPGQRPVYDRLWRPAGLGQQKWQVRRKKGRCRYYPYDHSAMLRPRCVMDRGI
ncbi:MAG: transglutaminase domain-containing protein, partial [Bacteroidaceae bacterium]|nr:transglutaminase domain-containing protein [Bacteroidaceae bacterium]